jgi:hypothetical protein
MFITPLAQSIPYRAGDHGGRHREASRVGVAIEKFERRMHFCREPTAHSDVSSNCRNRLHETKWSRREVAVVLLTRAARVKIA